MTDCEKLQHSSVSGRSLHARLYCHPWGIFRVMERCTLTRLFNNWLIPCNTQCGGCDGNVNEWVSLLKGGFSTGIMQCDIITLHVLKRTQGSAQTFPDLRKRQLNRCAMTGKTGKKDKTCDRRWQINVSDELSSWHQNVKRIYSKISDCCFLTRTMNLCQLF